MVISPKIGFTTVYNIGLRNDKYLCTVSGQGNNGPYKWYSKNTVPGGMEMKSLEATKQSSTAATKNLQKVFMTQPALGGLCRQWLAILETSKKEDDHQLTQTGL